MKYVVSGPSDRSGGVTQPCKWCDYSTPSEQEMSAHLLLTHAHHSCPQCGLALSRPSALSHHLKIVHNIDLNAKKVTARNVVHKCEECGKVYASLGGLHTHKISAHSGKMYTCEECGRKFNHPKNLASHSIRHKERHIKCTKCKATFYLKNELNKHINQVHRKCRPYMCVDCGRSFCQRSVLKHHRMVHSDHRPLTCSLRGRTFKNKQTFTYYLEQESKHNEESYQMFTSELPDTSILDTSHPSSSTNTPNKVAECIRVRKFDVKNKNPATSCEAVKSETEACTSFEGVSPTIPAPTELNSNPVISHDTHKYSDMQLFETPTFVESLPLSNSYIDNHITLVTDMTEDAVEMASFVHHKESSKVLEVELFTSQCDESVGLCDPSVVMYENTLDDTQVTCITEMHEEHDQLASESIVTQCITDGIPDRSALVEEFMSSIDPVNNENLMEKDSLQASE